MGREWTRRYMCSACRAGNMVLFDKDGFIKRYHSAEQILEEFFELRLEFYARRRISLIEALP